MVCRISFRNYSKLSGSIYPGYTYTAEKKHKRQHSPLFDRCHSYLHNQTFFDVTFEIVSIERLCDINEKRKILDATVDILTKPIGEVFSQEIQNKHKEIPCFQERRNEFFPAQTNSWAYITKAIVVSSFSICDANNLK